MLEVTEHDVVDDYASLFEALAAALVGFTAETGSRLLAEGVETQAELEALREIGVRKRRVTCWVGRAPCLPDAERQ